MKRILSFILIFVLCVGVMTSCAIFAKEPTAADAKEALTELYGPMDGAERDKDYKLVGRIDVKETSFDISWTVDNSAISIKAEDDGSFTVVLPDENAQAFEYTLAATVIDADGNVEIFTMTLTLPVIAPATPDNPDDGNDNDNTPDNGDDDGNIPDDGDNNTPDNGDDDGNIPDDGDDNGNTPDDGDENETHEPLGRVEELECGAAYYIHGLNGNGDIYFNGVVNGGQLMADPSASNAAAVKLEAAGADGEYYIYFNDADGSKVYIGANSSASTKTTAFITASEKGEAFVWLIDADEGTIMSKSFTNRGIASRIDNTYNNFRSYASSNFSDENYSVAWFVYASEGGTSGGDNGSTPDDGGNNGNTPDNGDKEISDSAKITFDSVDKRTELSSDVQVWEENGIVVTNSKGEGSSSIADYSKPVRFYKNTVLEIEYTGMVKIVFNCNTGAYATALANAISGAEVNGKVVTVTFDTATSSFEAVLSEGQVRVDSIEVYTA